MKSTIFFPFCSPIILQLFLYSPSFSANNHIGPCYNKECCKKFCDPFLDWKYVTYQKETNLCLLYNSKPINPDFIKKYSQDTYSCSSKNSLDSQAINSGSFKYCADGGRLSGTGGDGKTYSEKWVGPGRLESVPYQYNNNEFLHFKLNGNWWPNSQWGVSASDWKLTCKNQRSNNKKKTCANGGKIEGTGGDGGYHSSSWQGHGEIEPIPYTYNGIPFYHFRLDGSPWPNSQWGVSQASWRVRCN